MLTYRREMDMTRIPFSPFGLCLAVAVLAYCFLVANGTV